MLRLHAPAKLNLFLAITGRRSDGFHNLVSLAVPLDFGDQLELRLTSGEAGETKLVMPEIEEGTGAAADIPSGADNLVLRAAKAFRAASGFAQPVEFVLKKQLPIGAGLGGGSSDAVAALRGLNTFAAREGRALSEKALCEIAAKLGADCAFFVHGQPAIMRGRGELIEPLGESATEYLLRQRLFVCKPAFAVSTAWAYGEMATSALASSTVKDEGHYVPKDEAEQRCRQWLEAEVELKKPESLTFNNMEPVVFRKHPALPVLAAVFRERFGLTLRMSGSGSACFTFLSEAGSSDENAALESQLNDCVREFWGPSAFRRIVRVRVGA